MVYDPKKKLGDWQGPTIPTGNSAVLHDANMERRQPTVQTTQAAVSPQQQAFTEYYDTINSPSSKAQSLAQQQAAQQANKQRTALNSSLQSAATNRDTGLKGVESGLAEAKQRTEETAFQKYLASRQSMANKGLAGQGLARDEDVRLQMAHNREITNHERDAADRRYALDQQYNDYAKSINEQLGNIDESALFNQFYQQFRGQEMQEQAQKLAALQNYAGMIRQQEQDQYGREIDQRNFGYQQQRDQVGDQRYDQEFGYKQFQDYMDQQRWNAQFERGVVESDRNFGYQQQRDAVGDQRWGQEFQADQEYRNAGIGMDQQRLGLDFLRLQDSMNQNQLDREDRDRQFIQSEASGLREAILSGGLNADQALSQIEADAKNGFYTPDQARALRNIATNMKAYQNQENRAQIDLALSQMTPQNSSAEEAKAAIAKLGILSPSEQIAMNEQIEAQWKQAESQDPGVMTQLKEQASGGTWRNAVGGALGGIITLKALIDNVFRPKDQP